MKSHIRDHFDNFIDISEGDYGAKPMHKWHYDEMRSHAKGIKPEHKAEVFRHIKAHTSKRKWFSADEQKKVLDIYKP